MIKNVEDVHRNLFRGEDRIREEIEKMEKIIEDDEIKTKKLKSMTVNLKAALVEFIQTNFQTLVERNIAKELPSALLADVMLQVLGNQTIYQTSNK